MSKITQKTALSTLNKNLLKYFNVDIASAEKKQIYKALCYVAMDELYALRHELSKKARNQDAKCVYYLCMEFLPGKALKNSLVNLDLEDIFKDCLKSKKIDIEDIYDIEHDIGLGNGGLGRLASCFCDSLATHNYCSENHCLKYDYGLFAQKIVDSQQVELIDEWLKTGKVWLQPREDKTVVVRFGGSVEEKFDEEGFLTPIYHNCTEVEATPYDIMFSGFRSDANGLLRLWEAKNKSNVKSISEQNEIELISKVLYPSDEYEQGRMLRLKQQYFLASAAIQNIINTHLKRYKDIKSICKYVAIHLNDTHPVLCIPEMMRILLDEINLTWEEAWKITTSVITYTNHTVLSEALEKWDVNIIKTLLPRIYNILKEINRRELEELLSLGLNENDIEACKIIKDGKILMANLVVFTSKKVNGVSELHTNILKEKLFPCFVRAYPNKFLNITNGISFRKWLLQSNPRLTNLISKTIGSNFLKDGSLLEFLSKYSNNQKILSQFKKIKEDNKKDFADFIFKTQGIKIDYKSRFDVQVKRIHEYKRQLLNVLKIIYLYHEIKSNPQKEFTPQTFIFAGKAPAQYYMAKRIIKLINQLSIHINKDTNVNEKLKVVFVENYSVSIAEKLLPATDVSEQISLAGQEASGTSNMKAVLNGALLMCTLDGSNIEILKHCGGDKTGFTFGVSAKEAEELKRNGVDIEKYKNNPKIKIVIDMLNKGFNGESFEDISKYLLSSTNFCDNYLCLVDFESYLSAYEKMDNLYKNQKEWNKICFNNVSNMGYFSSDRCIKDYCKNVWDLKPIEEEK